MLLISYSENLFPINKIYYATLQEKRGIKKMILATTQDALLSKVLFTIGAFIGLLFLSFLYIGKIKDDKKANLLAIFGIPFGLPIILGSILSIIEYFTDIYGYKENSFWELYSVTVLICFATVMCFAASFWLFNRYALGLRLSKYRDMRTVALKTMSIPIVVIIVLVAVKVFAGK